MEPKIDLKALSNQDLNELEQQILAEQSRRLINNPNSIVVEPNAPLEAHQAAIKQLIERQKNLSL